MRLFKRQTNPIFVEDEQYNWCEKRSGAGKLFLVLIFAGVVAAILYSFSVF